MSENNEQTEVSADPSHLTRKERDVLGDLSMEVYGRRLAWQKMLRKGEYRPDTDVDGSGNAIMVQRLHHFTLTEIYNNMEKIINERLAAQNEAAIKEILATKA